VAESDIERSARPGVGFVGCCLPRQCGIATFTYDLVEAVSRVSPDGQSLFIAAMNDRPEGYDYPSPVRIEINVDQLPDYSFAADYLNEFCSVVSLQHEFGIFGGPWGSNVLQLLRRLRRPLVVTCHTVPVDPDPDQREIFREVVARADRLVVMSRCAVDFLQALYGARYKQIAHIHHGIHDVPFVDPPAIKTTFGVEGPVLLTFGLLHREKGLEYMVEAMPDVVRERPDVTYVIVGATHPRILEVEGESYRRGLHGKAKMLGVADNVKFLAGFCDLADLMRYLSETDIFVAPYLDQDRITSGALSYAVGSGKAVVATPFLHAMELLAEGRGRVVPARRPDALARHVLELLSNKPYTDAMRRRAYAHTRTMVWPVVAREYVQLFKSVGERQPITVPTVQRVVAAKSQRAASTGPSK
jgi:glycosyltransferase involved in cell wall biosynthesis